MTLWQSNECSRSKGCGVELVHINTHNQNETMLWCSTELSIFEISRDKQSLVYKTLWHPNECLWENIVCIPKRVCILETLRRVTCFLICNTRKYFRTWHFNVWSSVRFGNIVTPKWMDVSEPLQRETCLLIRNKYFDEMTTWQSTECWCWIFCDTTDRLCVRNIVTRKRSSMSETLWHQNGRPCLKCSDVEFVYNGKTTTISRNDVTTPTLEMLWYSIEYLFIFKRIWWHDTVKLWRMFALQMLRHVNYFISKV